MRYNDDVRRMANSEIGAKSFSGSQPSVLKRALLAASGPEVLITSGLAWPITFAGTRSGSGDGAAMY